MDDMVYIGETDFRGQYRRFGITQADRRTHAWILGKTGTGKSSLIKSMICQDIRAGRGVALIDAHGDLIQEVIDLIEPRHIGRVAYFSPPDEDYPVGLNILESVEPRERHRVASSVVAIFKDM